MNFDPISFAMGINAAKGSGGSSGGDYSDVHFVTFMSEDGSTELYKRPVADGDDCADPVIRGLISEPEKESTPQYNYTHVGWSATPNGALDENILKAVTADKTVYVNFAAVLRYYTITYYDSDGTTVLKTESLAYGATPSFEPEKNGYSFTGWTPALATVTGEASYTAQWVASSEIKDDWATIARYAEAGTASQHYNIGDTKEVVFTKADGTEMPVTFVVADFGKYNYKDANDKTKTCGIQFVAKGWFDGADDGITYSSSPGSVLYEFLPVDLKGVIKPSQVMNYTALASVPEYLFRPWYQELSSQITASNGTDVIKKGSLSMKEATYSATIFKLFENMTVFEIAEFFGIDESGEGFATPARCYYDNTTYPNGRVVILYNATYGLIKTYTDSNTKYTMCFCV